MKYPNLLKSAAVTLALAVGLGASALASGPKDEHNQKIEVKNLPAAVQKTILEHVADGYVTGIDKETENGKVLYSADVKLPNGGKLEIKVAEDGKLIKASADDEKDDEQEGEDDDQD